MTKKKSIIVIAAAVLVITTVLVFTAVTSEQHCKEEPAIKEALIGAETTGLYLGKFESEDGTTASLSDAQINEIMEKYDKSIDRYFSEDYSVNSYYKWLNKYYLTDVFKNTDKIDYLVKSEVPQCDINELTLSEDGNTAKVKAYIMGYNIWVEHTSDQEGYSVTTPWGIEQGIYTLVKENGQWKLKSSDSDYVDTKIFNQNDNLISSDLVKSVNTDASASAAEISKEIKSRNSIIQTSYPDFKSALAAAESINIDVIADNLDLSKAVVSYGKFDAPIG